MARSSSKRASTRSPPWPSQMYQKCSSIADRAEAVRTGSMPGQKPAAWARRISPAMRVIASARISSHRLRNSASSTA